MVTDLTQGYISHPCNIPAQITICSKTSFSPNTTSESGNIGISFMTDKFYAIDVALEVEIALNQPSFKATGRVAWCIPERDGRFRTGIVFDDPDTVYSVRMVEQICHIEHYRKQVEAQEGRQLSSEDAATEWIMRFAKDFPCLYASAPL